MTIVQVTKVDVKNLQEQSMQQVFYTYGLDEQELDKGKGVYRFLSGCRGVLEEVEYLGDVDEVEVKSKEECLEINREWYGEDIEDGEMTEEDLVSINDEYYHLDMIEGCRLNGKYYLINGWTEEDSDCFVRVAV